MGGLPPRVPVPGPFQDRLGEVLSLRPAWPALPPPVRAAGRRASGRSGRPPPQGGAPAEDGRRLSRPHTRIPFRPRKRFQSSWLIGPLSSGHVDMPFRGEALRHVRRLLAVSSLAVEPPGRIGDRVAKEQTSERSSRVGPWVCLQHGLRNACPPAAGGCDYRRTPASGVPRARIRALVRGRAGPDPEPKGLTAEGQAGGRVSRPNRKPASALAFRSLGGTEAQLPTGRRAGPADASTSSGRRSP